MEIIVYLIPLGTILYLLFFARKETLWWEYMLLGMASFISIFALEFFFRYSNCLDVEYLGGYITKIRYEEAWNEYIHKTCVRVVGSGKYRHSVPYNCSYVDEHPERFLYYDEKGYEHYFATKREFEIVKAKFNTKARFIDMHRHYHTKDGDAYDYYWPKTIENAYTTTYKHLYKNPIQASKSIFQLENISDEEGHKLGLYEYNPIINNEQCPVYGLRLCKKELNYLKWLNAYYGTKKQIRINYLFFHSKTEEIAEKQRSYWYGGNKNEVTICFGLNKNKHITWVRAFSSEDEPFIAISAQNWFLHNKFDVVKFYKYITPKITKQWKRKEFADFSYLSVEISQWQYIIIAVLLLILNIGLGYWIVTNEFKQEDY